MIARPILAIALAAALLLGAGAKAQQSEGEKQATALQASVDAMQKVLRPGPVDVDLAGHATLLLPTGAGYVRQPEAGKWASVVGYDKDVDLINPDLVGIAIPMSEQNWVVFINYHAGVRVTGDDTPLPDPDTLLNALKASNDAGNADRKQRGDPETEVRSWLEIPGYDKAAHKLIWAANSAEKGGDPDEGTANIHAFALGKDGYFELTMVSPNAEVASHLAMAKAILGGLQFAPGQGYDAGAPGTGAKERSLESLIAPVSAGGDLFALDRINWIWLAGGLVVLLGLLFALMAFMRHRNRL